jgi:hypothetical protein
MNSFVAGLYDLCISAAQPSPFRAHSAHGCHPLKSPFFHPLRLPISVRAASPHDINNRNVIKCNHFRESSSSYSLLQPNKDASNVAECGLIRERFRATPCLVARQPPPPEMFKCGGMWGSTQHPSSLPPSSHITHPISHIPHPASRIPHPLSRISHLAPHIPCSFSLFPSRAVYFAQTVAGAEFPPEGAHP